VDSNSNKPAVNEGFPMKEWTVEIYVVDQDGKEKPAKCFTKAVYNLHPSFENPVQSTFGTWPLPSPAGILEEDRQANRRAQPSTSLRSSAPTRDGVSSR